MVLASGNFGDLLDTRFNKIWDDWNPNQLSMRGEIFSMETSIKPDERVSQVEDLGDPTEFGTSQAQTITYQDFNQGFDTVATHREFASGFQIQRKLWDDDQYKVMDRRARQLRDSHERKKEKDGSRLFRLAFTNDTEFYNYSEGVALCSNSHTNNSGASTATGFDNLVTTALSAVNLTAMRLQMSKFRSPRANRTDVVADTLLIPPDLFDTAYEIVASQGKVDTNQNNPNIHEGQYRILVWPYIMGDDDSETNNYFLIDSARMKDHCTWYTRVPWEGNQIQDFDTMIRKWSSYERYSYSFDDWRWTLGAQVS